MTHDNKPKLEDLLKLKRHEKPNPEFWARFERELHEKNMQSLIKIKRNRIADFINSARRVLVPLVPAGAAAMVALIFLFQGHTFSPSQALTSLESARPLAQVGPVASSHFVANVLAAPSVAMAPDVSPSAQILAVTGDSAGVRYSAHSLGVSSLQGGTQKSMIF